MCTITITINIMLTITITTNSMFIMTITIDMINVVLREVLGGRTTRRGRARRRLRRGLRREFKDVVFEDVVFDHNSHHKV